MTDWRRKCAAVYLASDVPPYIDAEAKALLAEGRSVFRDLNLGVKSLVEEERDLHVFLWRGSQANAVFGATLCDGRSACRVP